MSGQWLRAPAGQAIADSAVGEYPAVSLAFGHVAQAVD
jgi:hypothetical protein